MTKTIKIEVDEKISRYQFESLKPLQGDLKSLSEKNFAKLRKSILKSFFVPLFVWKNKDDLFLLDGHQRHRVLSKLQQEGYTIPEIPCVVIKAANEKEAKRKLLSIMSQYGKVEDQGLYEFMSVAEFDIEEIKLDFNFADVNMEKFVANYFEDFVADEKQGATEISSERFEKFNCQCPKCGFSFDAKRNEDN